MVADTPSVKNSPFQFGLGGKSKLGVLWVLIFAEGLAAAWALAWSADRPLVPATPLSASVAALIFISGVLPALLRPGLETRLAGCLAVVLAALLLTPFSAEWLPGPIGTGTVWQAAPSYLLLRSVNAALLVPLAVHFTACFPQAGRLSQGVLVSIYAASLLALAFIFFTHQPVLRFVTIAGLALWSLCLLAVAFVLLVLTSRDTHPDHRRAAQQGRVILFSLVVAEMPALLRPVGLWLRTDLISYDLFLVFQAALPLGIAYAILRHDLFGIDRALRRALAYAALSLLLLAVYFGLAAGLAGLFARSAPQYRGLAAVISLLAAAAVFDPARKRMQGWVDRVLYPDRLKFHGEVAAAQATLGRVVSQAEVLQLLEQDLPPRLGAEWASLTLSPAPDIPRLPEMEPAWNARLMVGGQSLGRYWLGPRRSGPSYDADEQVQLNALVQQAALALAYAEAFQALELLNQELEERVAKRTTQVLAQQRTLAVYAERQKLARDLHDSVSQALFSINLSARALSKLARRDPAAAEAGLKELEAAAQQALGEMRTLLVQLRATPEERSLVVEESADLHQLLVEHCTALDREPGPDGQPPMLRVELDIPADLPLPAWLANETFQIIREALHNVIKHSGTRRAFCQVKDYGERLEITVSDDGIGFDPEEISAGYGLQGIYERTAALGGTVKINSRPGYGTELGIRLNVEQG